jgi:hypothetical protein
MTMSLTTYLLSLSFSTKFPSRLVKYSFKFSMSSCRRIVTILMEAREILKLMSVMN